ncbi:MAG: hypothetical protein ASARMPREDX12_002604 [Alectoria sarmentosa]|nr:MAG: hypothetical protein ASARMPREDX12_002604 [Alectoria sarmentosa]
MSLTMVQFSGVTDIALYPVERSQNTSLETSVPCWDESFRDPFIASVDGIRPLAFHSVGTIGYHIPENIALTTWTFNLFCGAWPKIILPLTKISSQPRTKAELNYVTTSFRNLVYTSYENDKALTARLKSTITRSQTAELHEAMRTAQPLATRVFNRQLKISEENWSTGNSQTLLKKLWTIDINNFKVQPVNSNIGELPNGFGVGRAYFSPSQNALILRDGHRPTARLGSNIAVDILMQVVLRRLLDMAQEIEGEPDQDHPGENFWVVRDRVGLELWPHDDTPCTASIAHKIHGQVMTTGYWEGDEYREYTTWDAEKCNVLFESWCWNCEKFNFQVEYEDDMLERHLSLREGPEIKENWEIRSPADMHSDPAFRITCLPSDRAGNIEHDEKAYTDGEIVREGPLGDQGDGVYSSGVRVPPPSPPIHLSLLPKEKDPTATTSPILTITNASQRGGAGNMDSPSLKPRTGSTVPGDSDVVPETALLPRHEHETFHTGRGGEGNVHKDRPTTGHEHEGLKEKAKHLFGGGKKDREAEGA